MLSLRTISSSSFRNMTLSQQQRQLSTRSANVLKTLGISTDPSKPIAGIFDGKWKVGSGETLTSKCPATGETLAQIKSASLEETKAAIKASVEASKTWRHVPAPQRGEIIRQIREALDEKKEALGELVSLEMGKVRGEGIGEVQEFVDICDYGVGLVRSMSGNILSSERPDHTIYEIPNPLGVVGIMSAFNFPVAVYGWNLAVAMATGNATIWKPSPTTPLTAIATVSIVQPILERHGLPGSIAALVCGATEVGKELAANPAIDLLSFTGSEKIGKEVGKVVQDRFGKTILELGGNNAVIIDQDADLKMALQALLFAAIGTAGQRCTTTRRLFLHKSIAQKFLGMLLPYYDEPARIRVGDPLDPTSLNGPIHTPSAVEAYENALKDVQSRGGEILTKHSGRRESVEGFDEAKNGNWVWPVVVKPKNVEDPCWQKEVFAPILYVAEFETLDEAIKLNNAVPQGLSSSLFTNNIRNVGKWLGPGGSDCGITNVNVGTNGAEIGAAFGGNKSTGWGRESGGDAWKQYVRWASATVNYGEKGVLAQGVKFDV